MKRLSQKTLFVAIIAAVLIVGSTSALYWNNRHGNSPIVSEEITQTNTGYAGPTDEEKQIADQHKDELVKQEQVDSAPPPSSQKSVTPTITSVGQQGDQIIAMGFVSGVFENDGSCTYTFTKGDLKLEKRVNAFANASTTDCMSATVSKSEFSQAGTWSLAITYASPKAGGTSQSQTVMIQR